MNQHQRNKQQGLRSHNYLRSRGRRLNELFDEKEDQDPIDSNQIDPQWSLSGTFSTPENSQYINLYNSSDTSLPRFPDIDHNYTAPPLPVVSAQEQQQVGNFFFSTLLPLLGFCFLIALCRCSSGGPPGSEFHRGHLIRENAQRIWAMQRRKAKRREATSEERLAKIRAGVCTYKVLQKDPKTGQCRLGDEEAEQHSQQQEDTSTQIETKKSTDTADTLPLEFDNDCESLGEMPTESNANNIEDFDDDDEDVCPICLDGFDVGDTVMFARNLSCAHVFHEECLLPWLLERRENECPSCREALVEEELDSEIDDEESNQNNCSDCGSCCASNAENEIAQKDLVDLEKGMPGPNDAIKYFIVKGRVVAKKRRSNTEDSFESESRTATTHTSSLNDSLSEEQYDATNSLLHNQQVQRPKALSVNCIKNATTESDSLLPLPLVRVSQSLPANYIQSKTSHNSCRTTQIECWDDSRRSIDIAPKTESTSGNMHLYSDDDDDNLQNRFPGLRTRLSYDSPSSDDSSDEDDAITRMVYRHSHSGPKNASTIFSR